MRNRIRAGLVLAVPLLLATVVAPTQASGRQHVDFEADLERLNQDGSGEVDLRKRAGKLVVELEAEDLDGGIHLAHIHGTGQASAECPAMSRDVNLDGLVDLLEGLPDYGPVRITLSDGLNDRGMALDYRRTFRQTDSGDSIASLGPLSDYAIVLHGVDLDGDGMASNPDVQGDGADHDDNEISMPALCGTIERH